MSIQGIIDIVIASLKFAFPCFMIWIIIRGSILYYKKEEGPIKKEFLLWLFVGYILCLIGVTVYRYGVDWSSLGDWDQRIGRINLLPLYEIAMMLKYKLYGGVFYNIVGNIVWFLPLGILAPLVWEKCRTIRCILFISCCISITIEVLQWLFITGISDIDDVIFNVMGGILGYLVWRFIKIK